MHAMWNETPAFFFLRVSPPIEKLACVTEYNCFTISFIDSNLALKMTPQEKSEWVSGSLFLQDLKGGV